MRPVYRTIALYDPRRSPCEIDLSDNTNLFGVPPAARRVLASLSQQAVSRYPSVYAAGLKASIAKMHGVDPENVVTGCGSDDVIDSAVRAFAEPGDVLAYATPTFGVVASFAEMNGVRPVAILQRGGSTPEPGPLARAGGAVTYVCSPNNPTGTRVSPEVLDRLDRELTGVLLLDEAYADFAPDDRTARSAASERTVSIRTFSKAYGLAGLRIGYAVGPRDLVREIEKSRGPYKVSSIAESAAGAVLSEDQAWVAARIGVAIELRERLRSELESRALWVAPSEANFLLIRLPQGVSAERASAALRASGVAVRAFPDLPTFGECIRVTIGPWGMMERFLAALDAALRPEAA